MKLMLQIVHQCYPATRLPYRLLETYITSDGYRSRICEGAWATITEAKNEYDRKQEMRNALDKPTED